MRPTPLLLAAVLLAAPAAAQDLTAQNNAFNARMNAQIAAMNRNIVTTNVRDPRVIAAWHGPCGRGLTLQQFAYKYAATGGCSAQGYANYAHTSTVTVQQQHAAMADANAGLENYHQAYGRYTGGYVANQQEAGRILAGDMTYYDPTSHANVQLRYLHPGQSYTDPATRRMYEMGADGNYYASSGDGSWRRINPAPRAPR